MVYAGSRRAWRGREAILLICCLYGACYFLAGEAKRIVGVSDKFSPPVGMSASWLSGEKDRHGEAGLIVFSQMPVLLTEVFSLVSHQIILLFVRWYRQPSAVKTVKPPPT